MNAMDAVNIAAEPAPERAEHRDKGAGVMPKNVALERK
jgi:hypothetical protein